MTSRTGADVRTLSRPTRVPLDLPPETLTVVAGLPGAGKTTLLRRLAEQGGVHALDPEDVARALAGVPLPYRLLRPLVHTTHLTRVMAAAGSPHARVLTSDPFTSPLRRTLLRTAAGLAGRRLVVVLVHASPAQARDGQQRRGRRLRPRRTTRHELRQRAWLETALDEQVDVVLSREDAAVAVLGTGAPATDRPPAQRPAC